MKQKRNKMLSVRASEEEIARVKRFAAELIKKNRYLKEADILRELIGLEDTGLITPEMRRRLRMDHDSDQSISTEIIPIEKIPHILTEGQKIIIPKPKKGGRK